MLTKIHYVKSENYLKYNLYQCSCGVEKVIRETHVISGSVKSCGCIRKSRKDYIEDRRVEYNTWKRINQRCSNSNHPRYKDWGGRGIEVCEEWKSFDAFFNDMGFRPDSCSSIDRIDNSKGYSRENCKWSNVKEQNRNKRVYAKSKTGVSGVEIYKEKYKSSARVKGILHYLGTFNNLFDAVCARKSFENNKGLRL